MNFLGHCLFSERTPEALNGSLWPDFARRPKDAALSEAFYVHFDRHQTIDRLTDQHERLEPVRRALRPIFRKTTPIVIDMMLDHHLALHWSRYHDQSLEAFAEDCYDKLLAFDALPHPPRMAQTLYWMQVHDWFVSYRTEEGLQGALNGMARRLKFDNPMRQHRHLATRATLDFESELAAFIRQLPEDLAQRT